MRFSKHFNITRTSADDWFDPHLEIDTRLFVDPFLLLRAGADWKQAHKELVEHFAHTYRLIAKAKVQSSFVTFQSEM